jgi:L-fucose mutarotase/ribose pyranase (RbsD/FucU family)
LVYEGHFIFQWELTDTLSASRTIFVPNYDKPGQTSRSRPPLSLRCDDLAVVDANHPAERIAREPDPIRVMIDAREPDKTREVRRAVLQGVNRGLDHPIVFGAIERFAFYDSAKRSFGVVQVGDTRSFGCFLIRKGTMTGESSPQI